MEMQASALLRMLLCSDYRDGWQLLGKLRDARWIDMLQQTYRHWMLTKFSRVLRLWKLFRWTDRADSKKMQKSSGMFPAILTWEVEKNCLRDKLLCIQVDGEDHQAQRCSDSLENLPLHCWFKCNQQIFVSIWRLATALHSRIGKFKSILHVFFEWRNLGWSHLQRHNNEHG